MSYQEFLAAKAVRPTSRGLRKIPKLAAHLFPFQVKCVSHHLRLGTAGCFLDTGLGKTEIQLEWCQKAIEATNSTAILWTPLAVAQQTQRRAEKWGYEAVVVREHSDVRPGIINICNYDRRDKLDAAAFQVVSCDEASILKNFTGKTTRALIDAFANCRFRLVASATPAPNDHMELGNYAEFLGIMRANEMLSRFFINNTSTASQLWRLKKHAEQPFWDWMASWSRMATLPSDLGCSDAGFALKPLKVLRHKVQTNYQWKREGLFAAPSMSATTLHDVKRSTIDKRAAAVADVVNRESNEFWIIWADTNYEADALLEAIPHALDVRGSMSIDEKEERLASFSTGRTRVLLSKPSVCGFGLDWSHCARMIFVGRSYSYETYYQAVRRCWRFGQSREVHVHLIIADGEELTNEVIERKSVAHASMLAAMRAAARRENECSANVSVPYNPNVRGELPQWLV